MFPQFDEKNPGKIASSTGGMLTTVICLIYVGVIVAVAALPAHKYSMHLFDPNIPFPRFEVGLAIVLTIALNLIAMIIPLNLGLSSLRKRDY
jgi:predicted benzoate:H+ symporter BenE